MFEEEKIRRRFSKVLANNGFTVEPPTCNILLYIYSKLPVYSLYALALCGVCVCVCVCVFGSLFSWEDQLNITECIPFQLESKQIRLRLVSYMCTEQNTPRTILIDSSGRGIVIEGGCVITCAVNSLVQNLHLNCVSPSMYGVN